MIEVTISGYNNNYNPHMRDMHTNPNIPNMPYSPYTRGYNRQNQNEQKQSQQQPPKPIFRPETIAKYHNNNNS